MTAGLNELERIPTSVFASAADASRWVANQMAQLIRVRAAEGRSCVLGLATGSTTVGLYAELVRLHREQDLSFRNVVTFNLDEYYPMHPCERQSYHHYMSEHLFDHVDIVRENTHIPDGTVPLEQVADYCRRYEQAIEDAGGVDLQILGIGRTGHIGFNEAGSSPASRTRLVTLDRVTRLDAAGAFCGEDHVPRCAITMGIGTILCARRLILIALGGHKATVVAKAIEEEVTPAVAASYLQQHLVAEVVLDEAAAAGLTRFRQ